LRHQARAPDAADEVKEKATLVRGFAGLNRVINGR
jgi:hypothetical protein